MKLIERYIYRELLFNLILGILTINTLIMVEKLIRVSKTLSGVRGIQDMIKIIVLIQPQMLVITIPVAFLISILLTYGRLNMDNELIAMKASGIGFKRLSLVSLKSGIVLLMIAMVVSTVVAPLGSKRLRDEINTLIKANVEKKIVDKTFTDLGSMVIYVEAKEKELIRDIFVYDKKRMAIITANLAFIRTTQAGIVIEFRNGSINLRGNNRITTIYFSCYFFQSPLNLQSLSRKAGELMLLELLRESKKTEPRKALSYIMEFYRRLTYPCLTIVISLIGPSLSLLSGRTGRFGGIVLGVLFYAGYYILSMLFEGLVESGRFSPHIGMILPLGAGIVIGTIVFLKGSNR